jgi:methylphosphotriester-DNA--protein-cysteine methyltransferase
VIRHLPAHVGYMWHERAHIYHGAGTGFLELLRSTDQRVMDICFAVGFASLGAFSWWFRQRVGVSPTSYRWQNR